MLWCNELVANWVTKPLRSHVCLADCIKYSYLARHWSLPLTLQTITSLLYFLNMSASHLNPHTNINTVIVVIDRPAPVQQPKTEFQSRHLLSFISLQLPRILCSLSSRLSKFRETYLTSEQKAAAASPRKPSSASTPLMWSLTAWLAIKESVATWHV